MENEYCGTKGNWFLLTGDVKSRNVKPRPNIFKKSIPETESNGYFIYIGEELDIPLDMYISSKEEEKVKALITKILLHTVDAIVKEEPDEKDKIEILKNRMDNSGEFGIMHEHAWSYEEIMDKVIQRICPKGYLPIKMHDGSGNFKLAFVDKKNQISRYHIDFDNETRQYVLTKSGTKDPGHAVPKQIASMTTKKKMDANTKNRRNEISKWLALGSLGSLILGLGTLAVGIISVPAVIMTVLGYAGFQFADYIRQETFEFNANEHFELLN